MPEIKENDLISVEQMIYQVWLNNYDKLAYTTCGEENVVEYETYWNERDCLVEEIFDNITAIYRKQDKDYICIWEKV